MMIDLSAFQRDLLVILAGLDEPNGRAVKDELEAYYDKEIGPGWLYPNLDTLDDKGLVEKGQHDGRANIYRLTPRGRQEIEARLEWEREHIDHDLGGRGTNWVNRSADDDRSRPPD